MHVIRSPDHAEHSDGLVGGDDQLEPRPAGVGQAVTQHRVDEPAHVERGPVGVDRDFAGDPSR